MGRAKRRYIKQDYLGEGTYSTVYSARDTETGQLVALKKLKQRDGCAREIAALKQLSHPNIVALLDTVTFKHKVWLVLELLECDLRSYLNTAPTMPNDLAQWYTYQLLRGIEYCHAHSILHRDLKPENLLLTLDGRLKIADFGLARRVTGGKMTRNVVTLWYRAPELLLGARRYGSAIDMWSVGCIMAEMLCGNALFCGDCEIDQLYRIFRQLGTPSEVCWSGLSSLPFYRDFPQWKAQELSVPSDAQPLQQALLTYDPEQRLSASAALRSAYLAKAAELWGSANACAVAPES